MGQVIYLSDFRKPVREPSVSLKQMGQLLGYGERWMRYRVAEGMPCEKVEGELRFIPSEVRGWLSEREGAA